MKNDIERIRLSREANDVEEVSRGLQKRNNELVERYAGHSDPGIGLLKESCDLLDIEDKRFLREMKMALRKGVQVFEEFERDTVRSGRDRLMAAIQQVPAVLENYNTRILSGPLANLRYPRQSP